MSHLDWTRYLGQFKCILQGSIVEHVMCRVISLHISLQTIQFKIFQILQQSDKLFCNMAVKVIRGHVPRTLYSFSSITINLKFSKLCINSANVHSQCHSPPAPCNRRPARIVSSIFISDIPTLPKTNPGSTYSGHITINIQGWKPNF